MHKLKYKISLCLFFLISALVNLNAQELPPIINYSSDSYYGGNQNWAVTQSAEKFIYVANNEGLLEFNGSNWRLNPSPNKTIIRSVSAIGDSIYTGSYMDFGYWVRNSLGSLDYHSLAQELNIELIEDEQFWNIISMDDWIIFQSLNNIYFFDTRTKKIKSINVEGITNKFFKLKDSIYFQVLNKGIYTIENGDKKLISDHELFKNEIVINIFEKDRRIVAVTQNSGFYFLDGLGIEKWSITADLVLKDESVYVCKQLKDNSVVVGTIANGIYLVAPDGSIRYHINQENGLGNNTALSIFEDFEGNIWVGLDNGIDCININAPIVEYHDPKGRLGTIYASTVYNNNVYLGTNHGLFYKPYLSNLDYVFIKGTEGQVWSLNIIGDELFCGHNSGTYLIKGNKADLIVDIMGTWDVKPLKNLENALIQGNYSGIYILTKQDGTWKLRNKISGFDISSKHFEQADTNRILVSHEYKGIYSLELNEDLSSVIKYDRIESISEGANSSLVKFDNIIYYGCSEGVFQYNTATQNFDKNVTLSKIYENDEYVTGRLIPEGNDRLWAFTNNYIIYISKEKLSQNFKIDRIAISENLRAEKKGYENISKIRQDQYLLGTSTGYLLIDISNSIQKNYKVSLSQVVNGDKNGNVRLVPITVENDFKSNENYFQFEYSIPKFDKYFVAEYQYCLNGLVDDKWSDWSTSATESFENLRFGQYEFKVKARVNKREVENIATYSFEIGRPWYLSNLALIVYLVSVFILFSLINAYYKRSYRRQRQRIMDKASKEMEVKELETQKEIIQLKNESLKQDIEARNRELAISTMSMIKKNNALNEIKEELIGLKDIKVVKPVVNLINKTMNDQVDWEFFEEAFNHADKDFFKKVKEVHPQLTANDLRLCVYLRLNLSSKEIAPLLNISPRSVEIKRYRLRKKITLDREINLNDYFINL